MTTPSKIRSTMMVAREADTGTSSIFLEQGAQQFACPGRVDIVAHVTDGGQREEDRGGDRLDRAQQVVPAPGANIHAYEIDGNAWQQPGILCALQRLDDIPQTKTAQGEIKKDQGNSDPQPELPAFHQDDFTTSPETV
jgi:hypothetical protein